jgi:hypothetical protein
VSDEKIPSGDGIEQRGLGTDLLIAVAGGAAAGGTQAYVGHVLNRPKPEPPPTVQLPPGVDRE